MLILCFALAHTFFYLLNYGLVPTNTFIVFGEIRLLIRSYNEVTLTLC